MQQNIVHNNDTAETSMRNQADQATDGASAASLGTAHSIEFLSARQYLNLPEIPSMTAEEKGMLQTIVDWAHSRADDADRVNVLWQIRSLENRLGAPQIGDTRLKHLYRWVRLDMEADRIDNEKQLYER